MGTWARAAAQSFPWGTQTHLLAKISPGNTFLRVLFGITGYGFITFAAPQSLELIEADLSNMLHFGLVTTIGNGTEAVPSPLVQTSDIAPPTQRWLGLWVAPLFFEGNSGTSSTQYLRTDPAFANLQSEGQVLATGIPAGETLNLWLSVDTTHGAWSTQTPGDIAWHDAWWSVLTKI